MKFQLIFALVAILCGAVQVANAGGDAAAGEQAYLTKGCIACHGPGGKSANPEIYPVTAGKDAAFLVEQVKAFRDGKRSNPLMSPMAMGLTDDDIANLAAYLSAQK
jgi:cytochrome c553